MDGYLVKFYIGNIEHACRSLSCIPSKNDLVRLHTGLYEVVEVVWDLEGDARDSVNIVIKQLDPST